MVTDKELDSAIEDVKKDIDQSGSIDEAQVEMHLQEMGFLWDSVHEKLSEDKICFSCKGAIDLKSDKIRVLRANNSDPGVVAFVSVCGDCYDKLESEHNNGK